MTTVLPFDQSLVRRLDGAGWPTLADRVIRGLCHDFNGRTNTLSSLLYLLESGREGDPSAAGLMTTFREEVERLEETVRLLRILPQDKESVELLAPQELLAPLAALVRVQPDLDQVTVGVDVSADVPATAMNRAVFSRGFLLLLTGAAEQAVREGSNRVGLVSVGSEGCFRIWPARERGEENRPSSPGRAPSSSCCPWRIRWPMCSDEPEDR